MELEFKLARPANAQFQNRASCTASLGKLDALTHYSVLHLNKLEKKLVIFVYD